MKRSLEKYVCINEKNMKIFNENTEKRLFFLDTRSSIFGW